MQKPLFKVESNSASHVKRKQTNLYAPDINLHRGNECENRCEIHSIFQTL